MEEDEVFLGGITRYKIWVFHYISENKAKSTQCMECFWQISLLTVQQSMQLVTRTTGGSSKEAIWPSVAKGWACSRACCCHIMLSISPAEHLPLRNYSHPVLSLAWFGTTGHTHFHLFPKEAPSRSALPHAGRHQKGGQTLATSTCNHWGSILWSATSVSTSRATTLWNISKYVHLAVT